MRTQSRPISLRVEPEEMTMEEFKKWLKAFDDDKDGKISAKELTDAFRTAGGRFPWWKAKRAMKFADSNGNGFIDDEEIEKLAEFAEKNFGVKVIKP